MARYSGLCPDCLEVFGGDCGRDVCPERARLNGDGTARSGARRPWTSRAAAAAADQGTNGPRQGANDNAWQTDEPSAAQRRENFGTEPSVVVDRDVSSAAYGSADTSTSSNYQPRHGGRPSPAADRRDDLGTEPSVRAGDDEQSVPYGAGYPEYDAENPEDKAESRSTR